MATEHNKLTAEEYVTLQDLFGNSVLMSGLRRMVAAEELSKLEAMRAEALGHGRASEIVKLAAESRVWAEWEQTLKNRHERMAPQRK